MNYANNLRYAFFVGKNGGGGVHFFFIPQALGSRIFVMLRCEINAFMNYAPLS